ncbi:unnamed protein product [Urochloa humidicola]
MLRRLNFSLNTLGAEILSFLGAFPFCDFSASPITPVGDVSGNTEEVPLNAKIHFVPTVFWNIMQIQICDVVRYSAFDALQPVSSMDEYFHCESCTGELVADMLLFGGEQSKGVLCCSN